MSPNFLCDVCLLIFPNSVYLFPNIFDAGYRNQELSFFFKGTWDWHPFTNIVSYI